MERLEDTSFKIIGSVPNWFKQFLPDVDAKRDGFIPGLKFPVLENFLIDGEIFWMKNETGRLKSGIWTEIDQSGEELYLEASAICLKNNKILLIAANFKDKHNLIQKARKNSLSYYKLIKETKKKVLIHCIIHDLAEQLTRIKYCFELLYLHTLNKLSPKALESLEIGKKQCQKQETLIRAILAAFSAEVESLEFKVDPLQAPDALLCAREVVNALAPTFYLNHKNLQLRRLSEIIVRPCVVGVCQCHMGYLC